MLLFGDTFAGLEGYGYLGIVVYMILTGCGLPTPEEVAIIAGGVASATGRLDWRLTLGSLLIGALLGDCVMYGIGYFFGKGLLTKNRFWKRLITPEREKKIEAMLNKHGVKVLLGARFLVGLRGPMYITAGILRVPFKRFVLADLFCATLVVSLFFGVSYFFGQEIADKIRAQENIASSIIKIVLVIGAFVLLWLYLRRRKEFKAAFSSDSVGADSNGSPGAAAGNASIAAPASSGPSQNGQPANQPAFPTTQSDSAGHSAGQSGGNSGG
jgi:membrane protein DedA with SNARE-associated domain